jgi:hypothetical protein
MFEEKITVTAGIEHALFGLAAKDLTNYTIMANILAW